MDGDRPSGGAAKARAADIGRAAEDRALAELGAAGLVLVARNFRCRVGEIDLVMRDRGTLVFVEVRQRRSALFGSASESVTPAKQRRLRAAAALFVAWHPSLGAMPMRFDLVALDGNGGQREPRLQWLRGYTA
jgi:putative endonuclease